MITTWPKGITQWGKGFTGFLSIPFTWLLPRAREIVTSPNLYIRNWVVGGPAVKMRPDFFEGTGAIIRDHYPGVLQMVNPQATRTTTGCPRACPYCAIGCGMVEPGGFRELADWPDLPVVCDNNLLASSYHHFNRVIDRLKKHHQVEINQGIDASLLTQYQANRLAECNTLVRIAWDQVGQEMAVLRAVTRLRKAGFPRRAIRCYVLIGYGDSPEDAQYRLETLWYGLGIRTFPMRYVPPGSIEKRYVDPDTSWTDRELIRFMKYWSQARLWSVPFSEFSLERCNAKEED